MNRLSSTVRISLGLACLAVSIVLTAQTVGLVPDRRAAVVAGRAQLCEAVAINFSLLAARGDVARMEAGLQGLVDRNAEILSAAIRRTDGGLLVEAGRHEEHWQAPPGRSTASHIYVPVTTEQGPWGTVEVRFQPLGRAGWMGVLHSPTVKLVGFIAVVSLLTYFLYLGRILQQLDPSKVVPERVRVALDTLAEGLLVLDRDGRIVLANQAFAKTVGRPPAALQGTDVTELPWTHAENGDQQVDVYPWVQAVEAGTSQTGVMLGFKPGAEDKRTFLVNSTPILGQDGDHRGVLASFDDVTPLEKKKADLARMLDMLRQSSDEIRRQNEQLEVLATQDPLTGCLNRRSFFERFDALWSAATRYEQPLSCAMVDVDRFKSVNDNYGHSTGDLVLQKVAAALKATGRDSDVVCRYGGEEFCVLLPHTDLDEAERAAERLRQAISEIEFPADLRVTASLGVSALQAGVASPQVLLDQADRCLYCAKRNGRNQVVRWDRVPEDMEFDESQISRTGPASEVEASIAVPYHAVTALISALAYRDLSTAEHSRRVADYCVIAAEGLMSLSETYILEMAALLHDIGKVGVPDSILLKPGPLTNEEWKVMQTHDSIGVEIIRASFDSTALSEIVENHHAFYGGKGRDPNLPTGEDIPVGARILTICDAYDAMVSDRVYRKGCTSEEAFAELRRCAGSQFDPALVDHFIANIQARDKKQTSALSSVSKQTALSIGVQIERLSAALDQRDLPSLQLMAHRLGTVADRQGVHAIAEQASRLEQAVSEDTELLAIVETANELLDLCRATQRSYLHDEEPAEQELETVEV